MRTAHLIQHSAPAIGEEEIEAVTAVLRSGQLAQGREVAAFEKECANFLGRRHAVAVSSGTAALHLSLNALDVDASTEVALPAYACASLMTAVSLQNGRARLCDVNGDFNLDVGDVPESCDVAIVPHLFGKRAALPRGCTVIEDMAQSFGGSSGNEGRIAIASFYATKLLTTGEGGMVFTDDAAVADHVRDRRDYDNRDDFVPRFSYKLTDMQAALGRVQLKRLPEFIARRHEIAEHYLDAFSGLPLELPELEDHVFFRFVVMTEQRDKLEAHLEDRGVEAKRPVHRPAHHFCNNVRTNGGTDGREEFPGADRAHRCALSLPIHPNLLDADVSNLIDSVRQFF